MVSRKSRRINGLLDLSNSELTQNDIFWDGFTPSARDTLDELYGDLFDKDRLALVRRNPEYRSEWQKELLRAAGLTLQKPTKSGYGVGAMRQPINLEPLEEVNLKAEHAEEFLNSHNFDLDPSKTQNQEKQIDYVFENLKHSPDNSNPIFSQTLAAMHEQLNPTGLATLANAGTGGKGREPFRTFRGDELIDSASRYLDSLVMGRNRDNNVQNAGLTNNASHLLHASTHPDFNNESWNKIIHPEVLNKGYGNTYGPEMSNRVHTTLENLVKQKYALQGLGKTPTYDDSFKIHKDWGPQDLIDNLDIDLGSLSAPVAKAVDLQEGYKAALITLKRLRDKGISEHAEEEIPIKLQELRSQYFQDLHGVIHEPLNGSTVEFLHPEIDLTNPLRNGNMEETIVINLAPDTQPPTLTQINTSLAALKDERNGNGNGYNGNGDGKKGNHDPVVNGNGNGHHGKGKKFRSDWSKEVADISASELAKSYIKVIGESQAKPKQALDGLSGTTLWDSGKEVAEVEPYWSKALQHVRNGGDWVFADRVLGSAPSQVELNWYNSTRGN